MVAPDDEDSNFEHKQKLYEQYTAERQALLLTKKETVNQLDKALLTLNAGSLAISITFIREIAPKPELWTIYLLIASWSSFVASLVFTLYSFRKSAESFSRQLEILEKDWFDEKEQDTQSTEPETLENEAANKPAKQLKLLNILSLWTFIAGIVILCAFAAVNFWSRGESMGSKGPTLTTVPKPPPQTGVEPPGMPVKPPPPPSRPAEPPKK